MKKMMLLATLVALVALMMVAAPAMAKDKDHKGDRNGVEFNHNAFFIDDNDIDDDFCCDNFVVGAPLFFANDFEDNFCEFHFCGLHNDFEDFDHIGCFESPFCRDFDDDGHGAFSQGIIIINRD